MTSGWRIGSIFGIPFLLNPAWFYSLGLFTFLFSAGEFGLEGRLAWLAGFSMTLLLFASVLLHELGHSLAARAQGIAVTAITLFPFGGIASIAQESKTPRQAFWVAIAGPAVSFVLFLLLLWLSLVLPDQPIAQSLKALLGNLANINFVMALFNLLPGLPLDGGQVLKAAVWQLTGSRVKGIRWAARGGQILGWGAILLGLGGFLLTLRFSFLWLVLLGGFGIRRASAYRRMIALQQAMLQISVSEAMRRLDQRNEAEQLDPQLEQLLALPDSASVAEAITQLEAHELHQMPVRSATGAVIGVIDRADLVRALGNRLARLVPQPVIEQINASGQFPPNLQLRELARDALN